MESTKPDVIHSEDAVTSTTNESAPRLRRPFHRATSEEKDPSYTPFTTSKNWTPSTLTDEGETVRRYNKKWTFDQMKALQDGVDK